MYEIAEQVGHWLDEGRDVTFAQVVATRGFSSRDPSAAAAWTSDGAVVGSVLEAIDTATLVGRPAGRHELVISDDEAVRAGLACGGAASVLVQAASALPRDIWTRLADRAPICLVTDVASMTTTAYSPQTIRDAGDHSAQIPRLFGRGTSLTEVLADGTAVVSLWPVPTLVVVGEGLIAAALADAAGLLGWSATIVDEVAAAVDAITALHRSDALVVLSHSREVDGPTLAAALAGGVGYVGALGSRRTQAARREWLTERGVSQDDQQRIHGPAGLDIDAHTPGEIAISIVAEIVGTRGQSSGGALRDREGPVHLAGVQAPPPRH